MIYNVVLGLTLSYSILSLDMQDIQISHEKKNHFIGIETCLVLFFLN